MSSDAEPARRLLPYLQRADELQKHEPVVAYYCRLYAMEKGLKIPPKERTKTTNALFVSLMNQLEKDKKSVKLSADDNLYLEGFASNVFAKADKQDRAGRADLNTAKTFYAASLFFEILQQFGELQPDIEEKYKYALWKASDIRKALKEGRKPEPGPPGGEDDPSTHSTPESKDSNHSAQRESFSASHPGSEFSSHYHEDPIPPPHATTSTSPSVYSGSDFHSDFRSGDLHKLSSTRQDDLSYQQFSHKQNQPSEHMPPTYHHDIPPNSYSNELRPLNASLDPNAVRYPHESPAPSYSYSAIQTLPSFSERSPPATSGHHSPYYQGSESTYMQQPSPQNYMPPVQYGAGGGDAAYAPPSAAPTVGSMKYNTGSNDGSHAGQMPSLSGTSIPSYTYDSNYQPSVEKIAEAHKAARFAVGALAFDDVPVAVEFLCKSLELLTNPKAELH